MNRIWLRMGICTSLAIVATIIVMTLTMLALDRVEYAGFYDRLPASVRQELDYLEEHDLLESPRAQQIYARYWAGSILGVANISLAVGLLVCLPFGLLAGFSISRYVTAPMTSIAMAAKRISHADFSVRATTTQNGALGAVVHDFNAMADALDTLERDRKLGAAAISHELRTPLAVLQASLHALSDGIIEGTHETYSGLIKQVQHLSRLIDDVHTLSIANAGRLTLHRSAFDLAELAQDVLTQFHQRLESNAISAALRLTGPSTLVWADRGRMLQVLGNLIENVLRYAAQGKRLEIEVSTQAERVRLDIRDWGDGLPSCMQQHLFERFYRPDASRTRARGGSGLGLAIVKSLMIAQEGDVTIESSHGKGCTVTLYLPCAAYRLRGASRRLA